MVFFFSGKKSEMNSRSHLIFDFFLSSFHLIKGRHIKVSNNNRMYDMALKNVNAFIFEIGLQF